MKKVLPSLLAIFLFCIQASNSIAYANTDAFDHLDIESSDFLLQGKEEMKINKNQSIGFPSTCDIKTIPTIPGATSWSFDYNHPRYPNENAGKATIWRTTCGGKAALVVTWSPTANSRKSVYFCPSRSSKFIHGPYQIEVNRRGFECGIVSTKQATSAVIYSNFMDINQAFKLLYVYDDLFSKSITIDIPAAADAGRDGDPIVSNVAGLWYDPAMNGLGFNFAKTPYGTFIYYYGYTADGKRLWLMSNNMPNTLVKGRTYEIEMVEGYPGNGANFNTKPTVDSGVAPWGKMTLTITDCSKGEAILQGKDGVQAFNIQKLAGISGVTCTDN